MKTKDELVKLARAVNDKAPVFPKTPKLTDVSGWKLVVEGQIHHRAALGEVRAVIKLGSFESNSDLLNAVDLYSELADWLQALGYNVIVVEHLVENKEFFWSRTESDSKRKPALHRRITTFSMKVRWD